MPIRNVGSETPISDSASSSWDSQERGLSAVYTPIAMPATRASSAATNDSSRVAGSRSTMSADTGRICRSERPNSPCTARLTKLAYCT